MVGKVVSPINCSKPISTLAHIFISTKSHTDASLFQRGQGARQNLFALKGDLLIKNLLLETSHVSCHLSSSPFKVPTLHFPKTKKSFLLCHSKLLPRRPSPKKISSLPTPAPPAAATRTWHSFIWGKVWQNVDSECSLAAPASSLHWESRILGLEVKAFSSPWAISSSQLDQNQSSAKCGISLIRK